MWKENLNPLKQLFVQLPVIGINPRKEKEMLEKQYYALMKQAETNCFHIIERQINLTEERTVPCFNEACSKEYQEFKD